MCNNPPLSQDNTERCRFLFFFLKYKEKVTKKRRQIKSIRLKTNNKKKISIKKCI